MRPDVRINEYYLTFISNAKKDIIKYQNKLNEQESYKTQRFNLITTYKNEYENLFKINIDDEQEAVERAERLIPTEIDTHRRYLLSLIVQYGTILKKINEYHTMLRLAFTRKELPFKKYSELVNKYYCKVHKFVLNGFGYKYDYGIGILCIWRVRVDSNKRNRKRIDFKATNARKRELLALGKKLYDKDEAEICAKKGIPYDGVDYRIYLNRTHIYLIDIFYSKLFTHRKHIFKHTEYINSKVKGMSYTEMADACNNIDEISNFPVDLRYKLNMTLHKDPSKYICYIRNDDESLDQYGAHNSQD